MRLNIPLPEDNLDDLEPANINWLPLEEERTYQKEEDGWLPENT